MRLGLTGSALLCVPIAVAVGFACASSQTPTGFNGDDGGGAEGSNGDDGNALGDGNGPDGWNPDSGCATSSFHAQYLPAALLFVLDKGGTMANNNKYASAQAAIVQAIDQGAFDSAYLGLLIYPTSQVTAPQCLQQLGVSQVGCGVSGLAQVPLQLAGSNKSNDPTGVRHDIYQQLSNNSPTPGNGDGKPTYDALKNGIGVLQGWSQTGKRILILVTDGGASCTSVSSPQRNNYTDTNGCPDWEDPTNIINLVKPAHDDPNQPINSVFVGVPGADTCGQDPTTEPPYCVKLALSAFQWNGSPETSDPSCNGRTYAKNGQNPTVPCHFDMTQNYTAKQLADDISAIRGKLLGCVFQVPVPEGGTIDPNKINVEYTTGPNADGGIDWTQLKKRSNPSDQCTTDGCWDYTDSSNTKIQLIGKACADVSTSPGADVKIIVGCQTVVK